MWCTSAGSVLPPLRLGSLICSQISASDLPAHAISGRRELPGRVTGDVPGIEVGGAVAGRAAHAGRAEAILAAHHKRLVRVPVVALQRAIAGGMAVHAARMHDHLAGLVEEGDGALLLVGDAGEVCRRASAVCRGVGARRETANPVAMMTRAPASHTRNALMTASSRPCRPSARREAQ